MLPQAVEASPGCCTEPRLRPDDSPATPLPATLSVSYRRDTLARVAVATAPGRAARPPTRVSRRGVARTPSLRGSVVPLDGAECTMRAPLDGFEWHNISWQLRLCRLSCHSMVPSARCAHHSMASSGTRMRQRKTARLRGYRRGGGTGRQHGGHGICLPMKSSPVRSARFAGRSSRAEHAASRTTITDLLYVRVRKTRVRRSSSLR